jgi:2-dehydropantoate 2-reductase
MLLPIMNGVSHYDVLDRRFGAHRVLGGLCNIVATMNEAGHILHTGRAASITLGERLGDSASARVEALAAELRRADTFVTKVGEEIYLDIWEKYVFLTTLAAATCLFRGPIGAIASTEDGEDILRALLAECQAVAAAASHPVRAEADANARKWIGDKKSGMTASMYRDLSGGGQVEADAIVGDMVHRAKRWRSIRRICERPIAICRSISNCVAQQARNRCVLGPTPRIGVCRRAGIR